MEGENSLQAARAGGLDFERERASRHPGGIRRKEAKLARIKDMYQLRDIDRAEYLARMREVQVALSGLRQRIQLESVDARVSDLSKAAVELINLPPTGGTQARRSGRKPRRR